MVRLGYTALTIESVSPRHEVIRELNKIVDTSASPLSLRGCRLECRLECRLNASWNWDG